MPKVSIIIPCHNKEPYLPTCLNSVLNQTLYDIEVLAIDDHSTDNTLQILKDFQKKYPLKLNVFCLDEKTGVSAARNLGLEYAQGEYVGFVDADDIVTLNMYQDFYSIAKWYQVPIVVGNFRMFAYTEFLHQETIYSYQNPKEKLVNYLANDQAFFSVSASCWDKLFLHDHIGDTRFLENAIFEDLGFTYSLLLHAKEAYQVNREDYFYRQTPNGIIKSIHHPNLKLLDMLDVCLDMQKFGEEKYFNSRQMFLLQEIIKENLLLVLWTVNDWKIPLDKKMQLLKNIITVFEYYFPKFRKLKTIYSRNAVVAFWSSLIKVPKVDSFQVQEKYQNVLKLVKSLENSSYY